MFISALNRARQPAAPGCCGPAVPRRRWPQAPAGSASRSPPLLVPGPAPFCPPAPVYRGHPPAARAAGLVPGWYAPSGERRLEGARTDAV